MSTQPEPADAVGSFTDAIQRVGLLMFQPFDPMRWLTLALCLWLSSCGNSGGSFNTDIPDLSGITGNNSPLDPYLQDGTAMMVVGTIVVMLMLLAMVVGVVIWVWKTFVNSRGHFMFIDQVVDPHATLMSSLVTLGEEANQLFAFRLALDAVSGVLAFLMVVVGMVLGALGYFFRAEITELDPTLILIGSIVGVVCFILAILVMVFVSLVSAVIRCIVYEFTVPIMYSQRIGMVEAVQRTVAVAQTQATPILIYILLKIAISVPLGVFMVVITLLLCCISWIPGVVITLLAPLLALIRIWTLEFVSQWHPDFANLRYEPIEEL
jgi:hypothetical protein